MSYHHKFSLPAKSMDNTPRMQEDACWMLSVWRIDHLAFIFGKTIRATVVNLKFFVSHFRKEKNALRIDQFNYSTHKWLGLFDSLLQVECHLVRIW